MVKGEHKIAIPFVANIFWRPVYGTIPYGTKKIPSEQPKTAENNGLQQAQEKLPNQREQPSHIFITNVHMLSESLSYHCFDIWVVVDKIRTRLHEKRSFRR